MRRLLAFAGAVGALALVAPAAALAGQYTLHPAGFGEHSYSAWKAHQGKPDSNGNDNQALYFQKQTSTPTFAAGAAVIKGYEGMPAADLQGLAWSHREDGHCGAGAPRWNVTVDNGGMSQTFQLGCNAAQHQEDGTASGHDWCRDRISTSPSPFPPGSTIAGIAIIFDEGNDTPNPPPAGCNQENLVPDGFVHLDNIEVQTSSNGTKCWTSANDNANGSTGPCPTSSNSSSMSLGTKLATASAPSLPDLASSLNVAYPGVALNAWTLYPNVQQ